MALTINLPHINITPEAEEDDDHNILSLAEALTDVEDLYEENNKIQTQNRKKLKIKLKLKDDGSTTDLEDVEASDGEENRILVKHEEPISLEDLDLEGGSFEETYKTQTKNAKGKKKLKTQMSTTNNEKKMAKGMEKFKDGMITDVEMFDTEDELEPVLEAPETKIDLDQYLTDNINIADNLINNDNYKPSPAVTPNISDTESTNKNTLNFKNVQFLSTVSLSPNPSDLTDIEVIGSDTEDEKLEKKSRTRKRRSKVNLRIKESHTDVEDLELSDIERRNKACYKKNKPKILLKKLEKSYTQSLQNDSEDENDIVLPFPLCKKIAVKNQTALNIPEFDVRALTDTEDFDSDKPIFDENDDILVDEEALEEKLKEMSACYSQTKEKHNIMKGKQEYRTHSIEKQASIENQNATDSDNYETDEEPDRSLKKSHDNLCFDIKFSNSVKEIDTKKGFIKHKQLSLPILEDGGYTDTENIGSSPEEESNTLPVALVAKSETLTDDEVIPGEFEDVEEVPDIELPPPQRTLILLKDDDSLVPTIKILPLDETEITNLHLSESNDNVTDEESFDDEESGEDYLSVECNYHNRAPTPELPYLEGGSIDVVENLVSNTKRSISSSGNINESLTDTEDIVVGQKKRPPKLRQMKLSESRNKLAVEKNDVVFLTDTEDVVLSDTDKKEITTKVRLLTPMNCTEATTDVENLDTSDEEEYKNYRDLSCTPQHMRELSGDVVLSKEGSGPFSSKDRLIINKRIRINDDNDVTPAITDTEDIAASGDEEFNSYSRAETATPNQIHKDLDQMSSTKVKSEYGRLFDPEATEDVMYLKGGGYPERLTDVEDIFDEDCAFIQNVEIDDEIKKDEASVLFNVKDGVVLFGFSKEWDASKKNTESLSTQGPKLETDAAQQGEEASSSAVEPEASSSLKAEGEETQNKDKSGKPQPRQVTDQHQLSEEMKELLKQLEKDSKQ